MGELRQWQCQGGSVTEERRGLRWLGGSQWELVAAHDQLAGPNGKGGPGTQSLFILSWGCQTQGAVWGRRWDTVGCLDWTILQLWDRTSCLPWLCRVALTRSNMAQTKSKWDNDDSVLFWLYSVFLFSYQCLNEQNYNKKKEKPISFWYRDIPVFPSFRLSVFQLFIGMTLYLQF